jgi:hypothetical protein
VTEHDPLVPLDEGEEQVEVERRREHWGPGIAAEVDPSLPSAARVRCETTSTLAEVVIWETGEADLVVGSVGDGSPAAPDALVGVRA